MHKITFYPLGNADTCRIDLANGKKILFDYANVRDKNDKYDLRIDLEKALKDDLTEAKKIVLMLLALLMLMMTT